jgi:hypothetical protein
MRTIRSTSAHPQVGIQVENKFKREAVLESRNEDGREEGIRR